VEIVPNPFGGVNTHLWRNEAYIVGIVPVDRHAYSLEKKNRKRTGEKGLVCLFGSVFRNKTRRAISPEFFEPL
jgi:hypothetical protein